MQVQHPDDLAWIVQRRPVKDKSSHPVNRCLSVTRSLVFASRQDRAARNHRLHLARETKYNQRIKSTGLQTRIQAMLIKRLTVWVVSMAIGFALTAAFVTLILPWMGPNNGNPISLQKFGYIYFLVVAVPIGLIFVVWLDKFMGTRILPD